jgi:GNAT superfamily N-acetyltransferase
VGREYHWFDRRDWTDEQIERHLAKDEISIWVMRQGKTPAGFFELVRQEGGSIEIGYLGLLPDYIGRGLGKFMLTEAVRSAWNLGANRVWLHTCTLDHPSALPNYLKRGFKQFKQERYTVEK